MLADVSAGRLQGRADGNQEAGDCCGQHREQEYSLVDGNLGDSGKPPRHEPQQEVDAPEARQESDGAASQRKHDSLDEDARDDAPS